MTSTRLLELLAPAKNLECGIAAVDHGADAVYIGASRFGARAAAGNSLDDIRQLCDYAHRYTVKVYVTVNTIIYDHEIEATCQLISNLHDIGVDAILVQDMGLLQMKNKGLVTKCDDGRVLQMHASTQTDNRTVEKVRWLRDLGFSRVVLARELSLDEIAEIHREVPDVELEVFVHGALCVCYSGQCYASQHLFGRSANRGECAQVCRMKFDLVDKEGTELIHQRHLLSLKDLNQSRSLEELAEAGANSFKIEGRLKDVGYVKNVVAYYSQRLDDLVRRHPNVYQRASLGRCRYSFVPNLDKTFTRGFTNYFLHGRHQGISSPDTPKAIGEYVGTVKEVRRDSFNVAGTASFANGDGLCFLNKDRELEGFRINRAEGNRLFPQQMPPHLRPGLALYRNHDMEFERQLSCPTSERRIPVTLHLGITPEGFSLSASMEKGAPVIVNVVCEHQQAQKDPRENIQRQLSKLGGTYFECSGVEIPGDFSYFIPNSVLSQLRQQLVACLTSHSNATIDHVQEALNFKSEIPIHKVQTSHFQSSISYLAPLSSDYPYLLNIANRQAADFYGVKTPNAFELSYSSEQAGTENALLMQCRYCLRYELGYCTKHGGQHPQWHEPLFLRLGDGRRFRLEFDCKHCQMNVYAS